MPELERWPDYTEQSWQQRFVTLDAKYKERGDAVIEAAYRLESEITTLQAKLDKALEGLGMAFRAIDDHNARRPYEPIAGFWPMVRIGALITSLDDARSILKELRP